MRRAGQLSKGVYVLMLLVELSLILGGATVAAIAAVLYLGRARKTPALQAHALPEPTILLFEEGVLHHATQTALTRFALEPGTHIWEDMRDSLLRYFPDFPKNAGAGDHGSITMRTQISGTQEEAHVRWRGPLCWVTLERLDREGASSARSPQPAEFAALKRGNETCPNPVWQEDQKGLVTWWNPAYAALFELCNAAPPRPDTALFPALKGTGPSRVPLHSETNEHADWYEVSTVEVDGVRIHHASCINALVDAEDAQRNFVQTLAKTFAHLSIGLAIFNRKGQLMLFNPALVDLSGLSAEFLSGRPTMLSFFDQLRENRRMPEPKNYKTWRQEIGEVIAAASDGQYRETWTLDEGQTYAVQGRPHPDGATAFLIEDISAEISLTRSFRAELELSQSLLDVITEGLVVYSSSGILTFCNQAYRDMWGQNPEAAFADVTIADCMDVWRSKSLFTERWPDIEGFVSTHQDRREWTVDLALRDGSHLKCCLTPVANGATLVRFKRTQPAAASTV